MESKQTDRQTEQAYRHREQIGGCVRLGLGGMVDNGVKGVQSFQ